MKKQLLIAAVAATMTSVAMADISITGAAQVNYTNTDLAGSGTDTNTLTHDTDIKVTGTAGATTVVMDIENTASAFLVKNSYMKTSVAGVNVKAGSYYGADSLLGNGTQSSGKVSLDTTFSGIKVQLEDDMTSSSVTVSGEVSGVALSYEVDNSETTDINVSGSFAGVNAAYRNVDSKTNTSDKKSYELSTDVQGVTLTYANVSVGTDGTTSDAFFGTFATAGSMGDAKGFGAKTAMAGNTVNLKSYKVENAAGTAEQKYTKAVVTRALASGATLEATYTNKKDVSKSLDLELRVKF